MKIVKTEDFSSTMNLPRKTISVDGDLTRRQTYFLEKIRNDGRYMQAIKKNSENAKKYKMANFPVNVNEALEPTVVFNQILKDIYIRNEVLNGNIVSDNITFVDKGLVDTSEEKLDKDTKKVDKKVISENLKEKQLEKQKVLLNLKKQINEINNLGTLLNYNENYNSTTEGNVEAIIIDKFLNLYNKGKIYRSFRPIHWCPTCRQSIEHSNVTYKREKTNNYYILYHLKEDSLNVLGEGIEKNNVYFIASTILPWTMVASDYIALGDDIEYSLVQVMEKDKKIYFILASDKVEEFMSYRFFIKYVVIKTFNANQLEKLICYNPLNYNKNVGVIVTKSQNIVIDKKNSSGVKIVSSGHSYLDYLIHKDLKKYRLKCVLDASGKTNALALVYNNMSYVEVGKRVIEFLKINHFIFYSTKVNVSIPYCKTCGEKLIYRTVSEWYLKKDSKITNDQYEKIVSIMTATEKYKDEELKSQIEKINSSNEIVISDRKKVGIPIPVFYCAACGHEIVGEKVNQIIRQIFTQRGSEFWYKSNPEQILQGQIGCQKCGGTFLFKDDGSLNEFFKDLSIPFILNRQVSNICIESKDRFYQKLKQMSFAGEIDDTFGILEKIMIHSVVDENMEKSDELKISSNVNNKKVKKKNHELTIAKESDIKTNEAIKKIMSTYGTDILRLWVISKSKSDAIKLNDQYMVNTRKRYMGIRRTFKFMLSNLTDFNPMKDYIFPQNREGIDKLLYSKLVDTDKIIKESYLSLDLKKVYSTLIKFCSKDLCNSYFESIKYRLYVLKRDDTLRKSVQSTLYDILMEMVGYCEPIIPFTLEEIWPYIWHKNDEETNNILLYRHKLEYVDVDIVKEKEKWERIYKLRDTIKKRLARAKITRVISEKIEATVVINTDENEKNFIEENYEDIRATLGVSKIIVNVSEERSVKVIKSEGTQCRRCRQYSIYVGQNLKYTYLCPKCAEILDS